MAGPCDGLSGVALLDCQDQQNAKPPELPQLREIGRSDSGLTVWEDAAGGTYALLPGSTGGYPTRLPSGYAQMVRSQIDVSDAVGGVGSISPTAAAQLAEQSRQFNLSFGQGQAEFEASLGQSQSQFDQSLAQRQDEFAYQQQNDAANREFNQAQLNQQNQQFNTSTQVDVNKANAQLEQQAALANQAAAIQVAQINAQLEAQKAQLTEQIRQSDIQDAQHRENMRFLERKEQVAVEEGNRAAMQNAVAIRETVAARIQQNQLQRQGLVTQVQTTNAQIQNNVDQFNSQEKARVEQLNEARRQNNLSELRENAELIGTLAQNPSDTGKLAAVLRAGGGGQISRAIAEGQDLTSDESLAPLRGALGAQQELSKGPKTATGNFIDANLIDVPTFADDLGVPPEIASLFNAINYTPGAERAANPAAADLSQFFQGLNLPPEIQAQIIAMPPDQQAAAIAAAQGQSPQVAPAGGGTQQAPTAPVQAPQPTAEDLAYVQSKRDEGFNVDPAVTKIAPDITDDILQMFINTKANTTGHLPKTGLEHGGMVPPGTPVRVGDSSDGKENEELAMVDAQGNLHVVPIDKLPRAENGGMFSTGQDAIRQRALNDPEAQARLAAQARAKVGPGTGELINFTSPPTTPTREPLINGQTPIATDPRIQQLFGAAPTAQSVAQTAQNPGVATGEIPIASLDDTRLFLDDVQRDALRRGGFNNPTDVSPLKVSAPGTSQFLKELSGSVAGTMGFGPMSLFFEELMKLTPQGVNRGVARRTA